VLEPAGPGGSTPHLIADILVRQRRVLLATVAACVAVAAAWVLLVTPLYEGASSVRIDREQMTVPMPIQRLTGDSEISTEIEVLKSRTLAEDAVRSFALQASVRSPKGTSPSALLENLRIADDVRARTITIRSREGGGFEVADGRREIEAAAGAPVRLDGVAFDLPREGAPGKIEFEVRPMSKALREFRSDIAVTRAAREANIVVVRYRTPEPELAAAVPNFMVGSFIERRQTLQQSQSGVTVDFLREQIARLGIDLAHAEEQLQSYRERNNVVSLVAEATTQVARLAEVEAERDALAAERAALAKLLADIEGRCPGPRTAETRRIGGCWPFRASCATRRRRSCSGR
jgi:tyrosine-protein kinase Etk/Wzc